MIEVNAPNQYYNRLSLPGRGVLFYNFFILSLTIGRLRKKTLIVRVILGDPALPGSARSAARERGS